MKTSMAPTITRRLFLVLPLASLLLPRLGAADGPIRKTFSYQADIGVLFDLLTFHVTGVMTEEINFAAGRYRVVVTGEGLGITQRTEASGIIRAGRFVPLENLHVGTVRGRESRFLVKYDYARSTAEYHSVAYTLILGRRRQVDDVVKLPVGQMVDDLPSAMLNFAANRLEQDADGYYRTLIVRRAKAENEGPDDVSPSGYHAELVPLRFRATSDPATGLLNAHIDITRFSSWARSNQPAHVTFDQARHVQSVRSALMFGSSFTARVTSSA
jgi:hypothetical protein